MVQHSLDLSPSQLESEEFEQKTIGRRHNASSRHSSYLQTHRKRKRREGEERKRESLAQPTHRRDLQ